jgi:hypothetical protein
VLLLLHRFGSETLGLDKNQFVGTIPTELGHLSLLGTSLFCCCHPLLHWNEKLRSILVHQNGRFQTVWLTDSLFLVGLNPFLLFLFIMIMIGLFFYHDRDFGTGRKSSFWIGAIRNGISQEVAVFESKKQLTHG